MTVDIGAEVLAQSRETLPRLGEGATFQRFQRLMEIAAADLCVAKLVEPHHDATAILHDLVGYGPDPGSLWAVWAAEPPYARVRATNTATGWQLTGTKAFCSGAELVSHALVTADTDDGSRLFAIDVAHGLSSGRIELAEPDWVGPGMQRAGTRAMEIGSLAAEPVGVPGGYVGRPGFWHGAVGIAACWLGGAGAIGGLLAASGRRRELDPHAAAHLGALTALVDAATSQLVVTADRIDMDPRNLDRAHRDALSVRATVVAVAEEVMVRTAHATGPGPLAFDGGHAQRVADLTVFIRQHHAERDLAELGMIAARGDGAP